MTVCALIPTFMPFVKDFFPMIHAQSCLLATHLQFSKRSAMQRAKFPEGWLSIPVLDRGTPGPVYQKQTEPSTRWRIQHLRFLQHHLHHTACFDELFHEIERIYDANFTTVADFLTLWHRFYKKRLGITHPTLFPKTDQPQPFHHFFATTRAKTYCFLNDGPPLNEAFRSILESYSIIPYRLHCPECATPVALDFIFQYGPEAPLLFRDMAYRCTHTHN